MRLVGLSAIIILVASFVFISTLTNANKTSLPSEEIITLHIRIDNLKAEAETLLTVHKILECESGGRHVWSKVDFNPPTFGVLQYQSETFYRHAKQAGLKNAQWKNANHQITLLIWALENGKGNEWTCYRNLKKKGKI